MLLKAIMKHPPKNKPGSTFAYANYSYVFAGLMAEQVTGQSWETLMNQTALRAAGDVLGGVRATGPSWGGRPTLGPSAVPGADQAHARGPRPRPFGTGRDRALLDPGLVQVRRARTWRLPGEGEASEALHIPGLADAPTRF